MGKLRAMIGYFEHSTQATAKLLQAFIQSRHRRSERAANSQPTCSERVANAQQMLSRKRNFWIWRQPVLLDVFRYVVWRQEFKTSCCSSGCALAMRWLRVCCELAASWLRVCYDDVSIVGTLVVLHAQATSDSPEYKGKRPCKLLQDVVTRWWSMFRAIRQARFIQSLLALGTIDCDVPKNDEWTILHQTEIALETMAYFQETLEGEKYVICPSSQLLCFKWGNTFWLYHRIVTQLSRLKL